MDREIEGRKGARELPPGPAPATPPSLPPGGRGLQHLDAGTDPLEVGQGFVALEAGRVRRLCMRRRWAET